MSAGSRRAAETVKHKPVARIVDEREVAEAWKNLAQLWRGLDENACEMLLEKLRGYLAGTVSQDVWITTVRAIKNLRDARMPCPAPGERTGKVKDKWSLPPSGW